MEYPENAEFNDLFLRWKEGDHLAAVQLVELVYLDLQILAHRLFRKDASGKTMQPTAITNEVCVKLLKLDPARLNDKAHFFATVAVQMRHIFIDHLRKLPAEKRAGRQIPIESIDLAIGSSTVDLLALDEALGRLKKVFPRAYMVVELRFIAGLSEREAAEAIGISVTTLKRDWNFAKAMLAEQLGGSSGKISIGLSARRRNIA